MIENLLVTKTWKIQKPLLLALGVAGNWIVIVSMNSIEKSDQSLTGARLVGRLGIVLVGMKPFAVGAGFLLNSKATAIAESAIKRSA